jgi:hypothetical protein
MPGSDRPPKWSRRSRTDNDPRRDCSVGPGSGPTPSIEGGGLPLRAVQPATLTDLRAAAAVFFAVVEAAVFRADPFFAEGALAAAFAAV